MDQSKQMLVELSLAINKKDERLSMLESQVSALQATVDSFTKDNKFLRAKNNELEAQLQEKWTVAEVLANMGGKIEAIIEETNRALYGPAAPTD